MVQEEGGSAGGLLGAEVQAGRLQEGRPHGDVRQSAPAAVLFLLQDSKE